MEIGLIVNSGAAPTFPAMDRSSDSPSKPINPRNNRTISHDTTRPTRATRFGPLVSANRGAQRAREVAMGHLIAVFAVAFSPQSRHPC
jgi:hypothetical protein